MANKDREFMFKPTLTKPAAKLETAPEKKRKVK
jgi:hypothetical protein